MVRGGGVHFQRARLFFQNFLLCRFFFYNALLEFNFFPKIVGEREGGENFFSGHKKGVKKIFPLFFKFGGHCTSDRPCQLIIFPIEKSLHEFFF